MVCLGTFSNIYPVVVPCHLDHSYAVEVYTSWILFHVKRAIWEPPCISCATACSPREGGNFTNSMSFIMALRSRRLV